jgi:hypothetical protein
MLNAFLVPDTASMAGDPAGYEKFSIGTVSSVIVWNRTQKIQRAGTRVSEDVLHQNGSALKHLTFKSFQLICGRQ